MAFKTHNLGNVNKNTYFTYQLELHCSVLLKARRWLNYTFEKIHNDLDSTKKFYSK
jgi:hypothetical protein